MPTTNIVIPRKRLMELAENLSAHKILYVQAPAGYGKTTFSGLWLAGMAGPKATATFDEYDNNVDDCCHKLRNALSTLYPKDNVVSAYLTHPAFDSAPVDFLMWRAPQSLNQFPS